MNNNASLQGKKEGYNYSAIEQNNQHIRDLFKKLNDRDHRVDKMLHQNRQILFRNMQIHNLAQSRANVHLVQEEEHIRKQGVKMESKKKSTTKMKKPGCGKADLNTGLTFEQSKVARNKVKEPLIDSQKIVQLALKKQTQKEDELLKNVPDKDHFQDDDEETEQDRLRKQKDEEQQFQHLYAQMAEYQKARSRGDVLECGSTVQKICSKDPKLQSQISHLEFLNFLDNRVQFEQLVTKVQQMYVKDVQDYGENNFRNQIKDCKDRRFVFKLINKEITFDQFIVRVNCDSKGVDYACKDDLIDRGVSQRYFDDATLQRVGAYMKSMHHGKDIQDIKPDDIANKGGDPPDSATMGEFFDNDTLKRKAIIDFQVRNDWRSNLHCLKSVFCVVPEDIKKRANHKNDDNYQKFQKGKRFQTVDPSKRRKPLDETGKKCGGHRRGNNQASIEPQQKSSKIGNENATIDQRATTSDEKNKMQGTRLSMLFIRQLLKDGQEISYDHGKDLDLLYKSEIESMIAMDKEHSHAAKKKGPREILGKLQPQEITKTLPTKEDCKAMTGATVTGTNSRTASKEQLKSKETSNCFLKSPSDLLRQTKKQASYEFDQGAFRKNLDQMIRQKLRDEKREQDSKKANMTEQQIQEMEHQSMFVTNSAMPQPKLVILSKPTHVRHKSALAKSSKHNIQNINTQSTTNSRNQLQPDLKNLPSKGDLHSTLYQPSTHLTTADLGSKLQNRAASNMQARDRLNVMRVQSATSDSKSIVSRAEGIVRPTLMHSIPPEVVADYEENIVPQILENENNYNLSIVIKDQAFFNSQTKLSPKEVSLQLQNQYRSELNNKIEKRSPIKLRRERSRQNSYVSNMTAPYQQSPMLRPQTTKHNAPPVVKLKEMERESKMTSHTGASSSINNYTKTIGDVNITQKSMFSITTRKFSVGFNDRPKKGIVGGGFKIKNNSLLNTLQPNSVSQTPKNNRLHQQNTELYRPTISSPKANMSTIQSVINRLNEQRIAKEQHFENFNLDNSNLIQMTPKYDPQQDMRRREAFIRYIQSLGIQVNQKGIEITQEQMKQLQAHQLETQQNSSPSSETKFASDTQPQFVPFSNLIVNDNQIQIVNNSAGGIQIPTIQPSPSHGSQKYQIIIVNNEEGELQTNKDVNTENINTAHPTQDDKPTLVIPQALNTFDMADDSVTQKDLYASNGGQHMGDTMTLQSIAGLTNITFADQIHGQQFQQSMFDKMQNDQSAGKQIVNIDTQWDSAKRSYVVMSARAQNAALPSFNESPETSQVHDKMIFDKKKRGVKGSLVDTQNLHNSCEDQESAASQEQDYLGAATKPSPQILTTKTHGQYSLKVDPRIQDPNEIKKMLTNLKNQRDNVNHPTLFKATPTFAIKQGMTKPLSPHIDMIIDTAKTKIDPLSTNSPIGGIELQLTPASGAVTSLLLEKTQEPLSQEREHTAYLGFQEEGTDSLSNLRARIEEDLNSSKMAEEPVMEPYIDYQQNRVTSQIYKEAYIGKSKQAKNIRSMDVHKKYVELEQRDIIQDHLRNVIYQELRQTQHQICLPGYGSPNYYGDDTMLTGELSPPSVVTASRPSLTVIPLSNQVIQEGSRNGSQNITKRKKVPVLAQKMTKLSEPKSPKLPDQFLFRQERSKTPQKQFNDDLELGKKKKKKASLY